MPILGAGTKLFRKESAPVPGQESLQLLLKPFPGQVSSHVQEDPPPIGKAGGGYLPPYVYLSVTEGLP